MIHIQNNHTKHSYNNHTKHSYILSTIFAISSLLYMAVNTVAADNPVCTIGCPEDPNTFLTLLEKHVPEDSTTAAAYYDTVDPDGLKDTYAKWLVETGFLALETDYQETGPLVINADKTVVHRNVADLGFVRVMSSRCVPNCNHRNPKIYSVIENYDNFLDAAARENRLASVAMEWTSPADGSQPGRRFVTFYAFTGFLGNRNVVNSASLSVPFAPDLDTRGPKQVPGLCSTCHGGAPLNLKANGTYRRKGDTGALFLPLDIDNFEFDPINRTLSGKEQRAYRKMNQMALITHASIEEYDEVADITRAPAGHELIEGWYGGPGMPNKKFDGEFVPAGWLPPAAPDGADELYLGAIAPACRSCHAQQGRSLDFGTYEGFMVFSDAHQNLVLRIECGLDDDPNTRQSGQDNQAVMPLALETYKRFWDPATDPSTAISQAIILKEFVENVDCNNL
jgi:hypothetical protein